jgi:putative transposase
LLSLPRSQFYYRSSRDDLDVIDALQDLAFKHPSYGFRKLFAYIRRSGKSWNHKKVYRVYKLLKLNKKRKSKRRLPARVKQPLTQQPEVNKTLSMDFMSDSMVGNRKFRTLNVMDDCSREALAIEVDTSLSASGWSGPWIVLLSKEVNQQPSGRTTAQSLPQRSWNSGP